MLLSSQAISTNSNLRSLLDLHSNCHSFQLFYVRSIQMCHLPVPNNKVLLFYIAHIAHIRFSFLRFRNHNPRIRRRSYKTKKKPLTDCICDELSPLLDGCAVTLGHTEFIAEVE